MRYLPVSLLGPAALILGLVLLAVHPLLWLVGTWFDPAYDSYGLWVAGLTLGLLLWSATSALPVVNERHRLNGLRLLMLTALVRFLGQWLGINTLGAAALAIDVYAIGLLLGLQHRARPLAPGWLALLFALALPIERILQRVFGFVLQQLSAAGACGVLRLGNAPVRCEGIQLQWHDQVVLVDLPCSGTRGLLLLVLLFVALAALTQPTPRYAVGGWVLTLVAATLGNSLRIVLLAVGLVHRETLGGLDVFAEPWHSTIGLLTLALSAVPLMVWAKHSQSMTGLALPAVSSVFSSTVSTAPASLWTVKPLAGLAFLMACGAIVLVPPQPLDVTRPLPAPSLPDRIALFAAQSGTLTLQEQAYFTRYGGGAARAAYGPYGLLVVSTLAPLRHLHSPEECLAGSGHTVRYLGQTGGFTPSAVYRSTDPHGQSWRITVSFISERGEWTPHVTEAVWRWLQAPSTPWRMVQRIAPWEMPASEVDQFDVALWRSLDIAPSAYQAQKPQPLTVKL